MNPIRFLTMSIFFVITMIFPHQSSSIRINHFNHPNPSDFHKGTPVSYDRMMRSSKTRRTYSLNDKFQIEFTCGIDDKVLCDKARKGFESAGQIITATISFKNPVIVNASFYDFCKTDNQCSDENSIVAGSANPTGTMVLTGDDGIKRHYPQALVKQLPFEESPEFGPSDITAKFNSRADFWFEGNESPIKPEQADFQLVVLHELIHGLGFYSSWNDFFDFANPQGLTPVPSVEASSNETSGMIFNGFVENIFDQHLIFLSSGERTSNVTAELNTIVTGDPYQKQEDFIMAFKSSSQYQLSRRMLKVATTPLSLGFLPKNANDSSEAIVLETSLNPYQTGSSLGHVDFQTYANTSDFLMTYRQDSGMTLGDYVSIGGNYAGGPIGPKLRQVLETMGYDIKESYDSPNILSVTQKDHKDHNEAAPSTISNIVFVIFIGIMDIFLMSHI